ncbi:MAG: S41 family peptidase [Trueperaceae bacterium]
MLRREHVVVALIGALWFGGASAGRAEAPAFVVFDAVAHHLAVAYAGVAEAPLADLLPEVRATLQVRCAAVPDCPGETAFAVLDAFLAEAGDPHTRVLAPEAFARLVEVNRGAALRKGVGLAVHPPANGLGLVVLDVAPGTPAAATSLARGDRIVKVNGAWLPVGPEERRGAWDAAVASGPILVEVVRAGRGSLEVRLEAVPISVDLPPSLSWLDGGIAWLRVPSLMPADAVAPAVHRLLADALSAGAAGLLLDLRDDAGGAYGACLEVAGAFVENAERIFVGPAAFVGFRFHAGVLDTYDPLGTTHAYEVVQGAVRWAQPVAVLVNARTSSAAEALASELQGAGIAVVGEVTAGMANAAVALVPLPEGYGLVLTVALAVGADGAPLPARVVPDVLVVDDLMALAEGRDRVLEAAWALLAGER